MAPGVLPESLSLMDVTVDYVKPFSAGTHHEFGIIHMTDSDRFLTNIMSPSIFAYRNNNNGDASEKIRRMKKALSKTLDLFYVAAGRCLIDPGSVGSGPGTREPHLVCNDAGVPFIDAYSDTVLQDILPTGEICTLRKFQVSRVSELYMRANDMFGKDLKPGNGPFNRDLPEGGLPALVIQVTRFKCGGVVMALVYPHVLMDATSFAHFMKAWSDIAVAGETTIVPDFRRELADTAVNMKKMGLPPGAEMRSLEWQYTKRIFEVSKSVIESMKQEVTRETNGSCYVSTVDCISAHFWHSLVKLGSSSAGSELTSKVVYAYGLVEGRNTSKDPPLPRYLWGNVIKSILYPVLPVDELLEKPASSAALRIRNHLISLNNPEAWRSISLSRQRAKCIFYDKNGTVWCTTSLMALPLYEIEFELLGKPSFVCPATYGLFCEGDLGRAVLYPPLPVHKNKSSATVHLEINPKHLDLLCSDPQFMSLFLVSDSQPQ